MKWNPAEIECLAPILKRLRASLAPLDGKHILVLCSASGEVPLWLAQSTAHAHILGLELSQDGLAAARSSAVEKGLDRQVEFYPAQRNHIPFPDNTFDGLVSEFILFPTPMPTEIGQPEMARVLKPGSPMLITDVIVTKQLPAGERLALQAIGLDYLCEATPADFYAWMEGAGLANVAVEDLTPLVQPVWRRRQLEDPTPGQREGYSLLLDNPETRLSESIFYIYVRGKKPL